MEYGTGAIFGCPAHDQRDLDSPASIICRLSRLCCRRGEDAASFAISDEAYPDPALLIIRVSSTGCRLTTQGQGDRRDRTAASRAGRDAIPFCATGASAVSVTGAAHPLSFIARVAARCRCQKKICLLFCPMMSRSTNLATHLIVIRLGNMSLAPSVTNPRHARPIPAIPLSIQLVLRALLLGQRYRTSAQRRSQLLAAGRSICRRHRHAILHLLYSRFFMRRHAHDRLCRG